MLRMKKNTSQQRKKHITTNIVPAVPSVPVELVIPVALKSEKIAVKNCTGRKKSYA